VLGLASSLPGFFIYLHFGSAAILPDGQVDTLLLTQAQTAAFWAVLFAHIGYVISARSVHRSAFSFSPFSNPYLLGGIALSLLIRTIPTVWPDAAVVFRTAEFPVEWWPLILLCLLPSFVVIELDKIIRSFAQRGRANEQARLQESS
jgi:magnesium-transporting ATPase (P-type)